MVTTCYFCRGKIEQKKITLDWRWGEKLFVIRNVPAGVCDQCGEKYLDNRVYKEMEFITAGNNYRQGRITVDILSFPIQDAAA